LQSNPFVVAAAVAITGASIMVAADRMAVDQLLIHRISNADAPILDGDTSDRAWRNIQPFSLTTNQGGNLMARANRKLTFARCTTAPGRISCSHGKTQRDR